MDYILGSIGKKKKIYNKQGGKETLDAENLPVMCFSKIITKYTEVLYQMIELKQKLSGKLVFPWLIKKILSIVQETIQWQNWAQEIREILPKHCDFYPVFLPQKSTECDKLGRKHT